VPARPGKNPLLHHKVSLLPADRSQAACSCQECRLDDRQHERFQHTQSKSRHDNHSQSSYVAMSVANGVSISFDYAVSSEAYYDYLRFYIDGVQKAAWSAAVALTPSGVITTGTSGVHEYKWCYTKDGSAASGSDTAWIDNIVIN